MPGTIVVGVGGDGSGYEAARCAASIADPLHDAVVLVFGYEAVALGPRGGPLEEQIASVGDEAIAAIRDELLASYPNLTVEVEMVHQRPVDALIAVAAQRTARMIAVGHGGSGPLKAALLGSTTYEVVHQAPLPVLVVPDDPDDLE